LNYCDIARFPCKHCFLVHFPKAVVAGDTRRDDCVCFNICACICFAVCVRRTGREGDVLATRLVSGR